MIINPTLINQSLAKTRKAIIAIGDSFVEGQGALDDDLYDQYPWHHEGPGYPLQVLVGDKIKEKIVEDFPDLELNKDGTIHVGKMTLRNNFLSVLTEKYFMGAYTPINFGKSGGANRGRIKQLYLHPQIKWDLIEEMIVIFMPTSIERFEFVEDTVTLPGTWFKTVWPSIPTGQESTAMGKLWGSYRDAVYSEKSGMIETYCAVKELETWCSAKNARLLITPAFDKRYSKESMRRILGRRVTRNEDWSILDELDSPIDGNSFALAEKWPWSCMFNPGGHFTMAHMCMSHEPDLEDKEEFYFQFQNRRSPLGWMTPCSHPGQKGHDLFARLIFDFIEKTK